MAVKPESQSNRPKWFGAAVKRNEDPALLTGRGHYVDDIRLAGHAARGLRAQPACAREDPRHRHTARARAARRAPGAHLCRPARGGRRSRCRCWCRTLRSRSCSCRTRSPRTRSAMSASRSRGGRRQPLHRRGRRGAGRNRLRAAARGVRLPRRARARRAAGARGDAVEHRGAHSVQASATPTRRSRGAAHVFQECCTPIAAARSSWSAAGWSRCYDAVIDAFTVYVSSQGSHRIKRCCSTARSGRPPAARRHARRGRRLRPQGRVLSRIPVRRRRRADAAAGR